MYNEKNIVELLGFKGYEKFNKGYEIALEDFGIDRLSGETDKNLLINDLDPQERLSLIDNNKYLVSLNRPEDTGIILGYVEVILEFNLEHNKHSWIYMSIDL